MFDIRVFKLVSGEEVVAKVVKEDDNCVVVEKPRSIQPVPQGPNTFGIALIPYFISNGDGVINILRNGIAAFCDAPEDMQRAYMQNTSGIQIASSFLAEGR